MCGVAHQPSGVAHLVHHTVAHVHASRTTDALVLKPLANVDASRADLDAQAAVNAIPQAQGLGVGPASAGAAGITAACVVADDEGVLVEHRTLEARIRTHVLADLLAHPAGVTVGGKAIERDPEPLPGAEVQRQGLDPQTLDGREVPHQGEPGPQRDQQPDAVLGRLAGHLVQRPGATVQTHACRAVALDAPLHPKKDLGVNRLRTGIAAPQAPCHGREQEQRVGADHQQTGQVDEVLWVQDEVEDVEATADEVEQDCLPIVPLQPGQAVVQQLGGKHQRPTPAYEPTRDRPGVDLALCLVQRDDGAGGVIVRRWHGCSCWGHPTAWPMRQRGITWPPRWSIGRDSAHRPPARAPAPASDGQPARASRCSCRW